MKQVVVSFSGGRTSAYLCSLIKESHPRKNLPHLELSYNPLKTLVKCV